MLHPVRTMRTVLLAAIALGAAAPAVAQATITTTTAAKVAVVDPAQVGARLAEKLDEECRKTTKSESAPLGQSCVSYGDMSCNWTLALDGKTLSSYYCERTAKDANGQTTRPVAEPRSPWGRWKLAGADGRYFKRLNGIFANDLHAQCVKKTSRTCARLGRTRCEGNRYEFRVDPQSNLPTADLVRYHCSRKGSKETETNRSLG